MSQAYSYYDDLSAGSDEYSYDSDPNKDDDEHRRQAYEEDDEDAEWFFGSRNKSQRHRQEDEHQQRYTTLANGLWERCILHLDVDCFYCQCEEIDRKIHDMVPPRPLAIGQKHIIVTCNYEARKYGVKKLQSREGAYAACPDLWIVEGSDLLHYRRYSRAIYEAFRAALAQLAHEHGLSPGSLPAKKGCMDEMMADLTPLIKHLTQGRAQGQRTNTPDLKQDSDQSRFIFGEDSCSSVAVLVEDQTGQRSIVHFDPNTSSQQQCRPLDARLTESRRNVHDLQNIQEGVEYHRRQCQERLTAAASVTAHICHEIRRRTGFGTTGGVSVSPLLAKLASGLHKPKSVNLLYPWRSSQLLYAMPLRKMHMVGRGTVKALESQFSSTASRDDPFSTLSDQTKQLQTGTDSKTKEMRTVIDFLELPQQSIQQALRGMTAFQGGDGTNSAEQANLLIQHCRGLDPTEVDDDEGGLPKTVSVENSFRRGTIRALAKVHEGLQDLYRRLPVLVQDRTSWAKDPTKAYPTTLRLTMRMVDPHLALTKKRRPYVTKSKQQSFDGKRLFQSTVSLEAQSELLRTYVQPLLQQLLPTQIDITRINIAVSNFQDTGSSKSSSPTASTIRSGQPTLVQSLQRPKRSLSSTQDSFAFKRNKIQSPSNSHLSSNDGSKSSISERVTPSPPGPILSRVLSSHPAKTTTNQAKRSKMKSTRIDNFFNKK